MSEIEETFSRLRKNDQGALIAYFTAGDPKPCYTPPIVEAAAEGGIDIIEIGIPFTDPIADGPTLQAAAVRALKAGTRPKNVLKLCEEIKQRNSLPIVVLTYYNLIFRMGVKKFFESAKASGVSGVIVPDLPVEEAYEYKRFAEASLIDTIFLSSPSTSGYRLKKIVEYTSGFIYLVSVFGVTGVRNRLQELTLCTIRRTLSVTNGRIPLAVGFGISKPEHVRMIIQNGADAAIVGSGFAKIIEKHTTVDEKMFQDIRDYAFKLKDATFNKNRKMNRNSYK